MEFRTLRAFVEVVRQGGFSQAARTVFATQSAVSKSVKLLEEEIGVPLIDRTGHRIRLTTAGEIVYPRAVRLLAERADLIAELEELRGLKRGTLRLGLPPVGSSILFAPVFAAYRNRYPGVDVRLVEHGADRLEQALLSGEIEIAASVPPMSAGFEHHEIRREPLMAVLPQDHTLAQRPSVGLEALRDLPFILFESGFGVNRIILDRCRRHGFEPLIAARSSQVDFIVELAAVGLGVAFLPRVVAEARRPDWRVDCVQLDEPESDYCLSMIWRSGAYLSEAAKAWLALVREHYSNRD